MLSKHLDELSPDERRMVKAIREVGVKLGLEVDAQTRRLLRAGFKLEEAQKIVIAAVTTAGYFAARRIRGESFEGVDDELDAAVLQLIREN